MAELLGQRTTTRWPGDRRHGKPAACADQRPAPPQSARPAVPAAPAPSRGHRPCQQSPAGSVQSLPRRPSGGCRHGSADGWCRRDAAGRRAAERQQRRTPAGAHRVAGDDHRAPAIHPAHGRRPDGRQAARLRGQRLRASPCRSAGSIPSRTSGTSSRAWTCRIGCAFTSRSSRARSPRRPAWPNRSSPATAASASFACITPLAARPMPPFAWPVLTLLHALSAPHPQPGWIAPGWPTTWRRCCTAAAPCHPRLSDAGLVKLFRLLRLARPAAGSGSRRQRPRPRHLSGDQPCPHRIPLNQAVIAQALHDLRNGNCAAARPMASARKNWMR